MRIVAPGPTSPSCANDDPVVLYRCWDADGALLYIGVTRNLKQRSYFHKKASPWWHEVASVTSVPYPTRWRGNAAERWAIVTENPRHNAKRNYVTFLAEDVERVPLADPCEVCGCRSHTRLWHGELAQFGDVVLSADEWRLRGVS